MNENNYEALGSHKNPKAGGPFNGRLNAARQVKIYCDYEYVLFMTALKLYMFSNFKKFKVS
jgi:hypothetical protein